MKLKGKQLIRSNNYLKMKVVLDVKGLLEKYVPNIFHFVELDSEYENIKTKQKRIMLKRIKTLEAVNRGDIMDFNFDFYSDANLYDLLYVASKIKDGIFEEFFAKNLSSG